MFHVAIWCVRTIELCQLLCKSAWCRGMKDAGAEVETWSRARGHEAALAHPDELKKILLDFEKKSM